MKTLSIDLETRSSIDIGKSGVYRYAESEDFDILLFGVSVDGESVTVYDLACGDILPEDLLQALSDPEVISSSMDSLCSSMNLIAYS